jgi:UPF0755 protein
VKNGSVRNIILGIVLLVFTLSGGAAWLAWRRFALQPLDPAGGDLVVDVAPGANFFAIRKQLADQSILIDPFFMRLWIRATGATNRLRVGEYRIDRAWSQKKILDQILSGEPVLHKLVIKEGYNLWDIRAEFAHVWSPKEAAALVELASKPEYLDRMGVPRTLPGGVKRTLEGFLFPETYSYSKYDSPRKVVEAMLDQFDRRVRPLLEKHEWGQTPEGLYRLLTLASIVEKESGPAAEQPLVASVFWNRLKKKMRLQSDPTTIYGLLPNFDGNLTKLHLLTTTPYNTYKIPELPAGPISNPGESAIRAVLQPAETDYLFFVSRGDGTHAFSADYKTHTNNVNVFLLHQKAH